MRDTKKQRLERAQEIARQVREGVYIPPSFDSEMSFFPSRPAPKKDPKAIAQIFGKGDDDV